MLANPLSFRGLSMTNFKKLTMYITPYFRQPSALTFQFEILSMIIRLTDCSSGTQQGSRDSEHSSRAILKILSVLSLFTMYLNPRHYKTQRSGYSFITNTKKLILLAFWWATKQICKRIQGLVVISKYNNKQRS